MATTTDYMINEAAASPSSITSFSISQSGHVSDLHLLMPPTPGKRRNTRSKKRQRRRRKPDLKESSEQEFPFISVDDNSRETRTLVRSVVMRDARRKQRTTQKTLVSVL